MLDAVLAELARVVGAEHLSAAEADCLSVARDYSPLHCLGLLRGDAAPRPAAVVWPEAAGEVAAVLRILRREGIPVTVYGGGTGVVGGGVAAPGGVVLATRRLDGLSVDGHNLTARAGAGLIGQEYEDRLRAAGYTGGHAPQSMRASTVGGWLSCRAAGQFSTMYGKVEDTVLAIQAVLPDGTIIDQRVAPATAAGPPIEGLLIGAEGTLGVITAATLRIWPVPERSELLSFAWDNPRHCLECLRLLLRRGLAPAVLRLYDDQETGRNFADVRAAEGKWLLVAVCEGDAALVGLTGEALRRGAVEAGATDCGEGPAQHWLAHRFDVSLAASLLRRGLLVETIEVAGMWDQLGPLYAGMTAAIAGVEGTMAVSGHYSHFYPQGACLYLSLCGFPPEDDPAAYHRHVWEAAMGACLAAGGTISHHHGVGRVRQPYLEAERGGSLQLLRAVKGALDPAGLLNPGLLMGGEGRD
ncbi:MAG: FAD-binding oxidoreductase [Bacillota bacterium]